MADTGPDPRELIEVLTAQPLGDDRFRAEPPNWFGEQVFGGVVVGQAVNAALQTVDDPSSLHSLHGYFLRPTRATPAVELAVDRVRDGRSFQTREVRSRQDGKLVFSMVCSFHAPESGEEYELAMPTDVPPPEELDPPDDEYGPPDELLQIREAGPTPVESDGTYRSTRRAWLRHPLASEDPLDHLTVAAYLSDMTGTSFRPHNLGEWGTHMDASLDHAVWFHRPIRVDEWLLYDLQAVINHAGRSVVRGSMYGRDGRLRMTLMQELLIRPLPPQPS